MNCFADWWSRRSKHIDITQACTKLIGGGESNRHTWRSEALYVKGSTRIALHH